MLKTKKDNWIEHLETILTFLRSMKIFKTWYLPLKFFYSGHFNIIYFNLSVLLILLKALWRPKSIKLQECFKKRKKYLRMLSLNRLYNVQNKYTHIGWNQYREYYLYSISVTPDLIRKTRRHILHPYFNFCRNSHRSAFVSIINFNIVYRLHFTDYSLGATSLFR